MVFVWLFVLGNDVFQLTFRTTLKDEDYNITLWSYGIFITTIILLLDIILTLVTGYLDKKTKQVVLIPHKIFVHYLQGWFWIDSLTLIIIIRWVLGDLAMTPYVYVNKAFGLMRYIRVIKLYYVLNHVKWITDACKFGHAQYLLTCLVIVSTYTLHFNACLYIFIPSLLMEVTPDNQAHVQSWIFRISVQYLKQNLSTTSMTLYAHSLLECLYKFNLGRTHLITPIKYEEMLLCNIFLVFSYILKAGFFLVFYYVLSGNYLTSVTNSLHENCIESFIKVNSVPKNLKQKFFTYYDHQINKNNMKLKHLRDISPTLNLEILTEMWRYGFAETKLFQKIPRDLLQRFAIKFQVTSYLLNTVIYDHGEPANFLGFICSGSIALFDDNGEEERHLRDGQYYGIEAADVFNKNPVRTHRVVALEICEVIIITRDNLVYLANISKNFEEFMLELFKEGYWESETTFTHSKNYFFE